MANDLDQQINAEQPHEKIPAAAGAVIRPAVAAGAVVVLLLFFAGGTVGIPGLPAVPAFLLPVVRLALRAPGTEEILKGIVLLITGLVVLLPGLLPGLAAAPAADGKPAGS